MGRTPPEQAGMDAGSGSDRHQLTPLEAEELMDAIRSGSVDAFVIGPDGREQVYTLTGSDQSYRIFVERMREGAATLSRDGVILYCNRSFSSLLGLPRQEVVGSRLRDFVAPREHGGFDAFLPNSVDGDGQVESLLVDVDGRRVPVYLSRSMADFDGVVCVCLIVTDLTAQKKHEQIVASERLARSILTQAAETIIVCDDTGTIIHASKESEQLLGHNPLRNSFADTFRLRLAGTNGNDADPTERLVGTRETTVRREVTLTRSDGRRFNLLVSSAPLLGDAGRLLGTVLVLTDVTELKRVEAELRELADTLESRVEERTEQVRLLASALSMAEQEERRRIAAVLHDHLQQMLFGLRLKLENLAAEIEPEEDTPVALALKDVRSLAGVAIGVTRNLTVELSPPVLAGDGLYDSIEWLCGHVRQVHGLRTELRGRKIYPLSEDLRVLLFHIVRELLFNVVKHAGVDRASIEIMEADGFLHVTVSDEGEGFDLEGIDMKEGEEGHYGLFNVRDRLKLIGGRLKIDTTPGRGTRMSIIAPLRPTHRKAGNAAVGAYRVFLVEDNPLIRESYGALLELELDIEVSGEVESAAEALSHIEQNECDLAVVDVSLPDLDGIELVKKLLQIRPGLKVLVVSGHSDPSYHKRAAEAGAVGYVDKNDAGTELMPAIRRALGEVR